MRFWKTMEGFVIGNTVGYIYIYAELDHTRPPFLIAKTHTDDCFNSRMDDYTIIRHYIIYIYIYLEPKWPPFLWDWPPLHKKGPTFVLQPSKHPSKHLSDSQGVLAQLYGLWFGCRRIGRDDWLGITWSNGDHHWLPGLLGRGWGLGFGVWGWLKGGKFYVFGGIVF